MRIILFIILLLSCGENLADGREFEGPDSQGIKQPSFSGKLYASNIFATSSAIIEIDGPSNSYKSFSLSNEEHMPFAKNDGIYFTSRNNLSHYNIYSVNRLTNSKKNVFLRNYDMLFSRRSNDNSYWAWVNRSSNSIILHKSLAQTDSIIYLSNLELRGVSWLPDNSAFLFHEEDDENSKIYFYQLSNNSLSFLVNGRYADPSSDSKKIVYSNGTDILEMDLTTKISTSIYSATNVNNPVYSPDDSEIAFTEGSSTFHIRIIKHDGSNKRFFPSYGTSDVYLYWAD